MPYALIDSFKLGLDRRRMAVASVPGSLQRLENCHITRGGEIEKRKAFVEAYALPAGDTHGLVAVAGSLYVFGDGTTPAGMPAGVEYQQIAHPSATALSRVLSAAGFQGDPYVVGEYVDGSIHHFFDGTRITDWFDGRAKASFAITGGTASAGVNKVDSIKVNGIEVLNTAVDWTTDNSTTAAAVASQINTYNSTPEYTATSVEDTVIVSYFENDTAPNGWVVEIAVGGDVTVSPSSTTMSGGAASGATFTPGTAVLTLGSKVYAISGSLLHFSAIGDPTHWTTGYVGAGFIDLSQFANGSDDLIGLAPYLQKLAVFSDETIQIWNIDEDPELNAIDQPLRNIGSISPRSIQPVGTTDVFFLGRSGVRSLRSRSEFDVAAVSDLGTPVDEDIQDLVASLSSTTVERAAAAIDPLDGRYVLAIGDTCYVLSQFPAAKILAWATWQPGFTISEWAVTSGRLFARAGDTVYEYGPTYDTTVAVAETGYLSADDPAAMKELTGFDIACEGTWKIEVQPDLANPDYWVDVATVVGSTFHQMDAGIGLTGTHFKWRFTSERAERARIGQFVMHFRPVSTG